MKLKFLFVIALLGISLLTLQSCSALNGIAPKSATITRQKRAQRTRVPRATARARRTETASPKSPTRSTDIAPTSTPSPSPNPAPVADQPALALTPWTPITLEFAAVSTRTGKELWDTVFDLGIDNSPTLADGILYVGGNVGTGNGAVGDGYLYALH